MKYKAEQCNNMQSHETGRKPKESRIFHFIYFDYACVELFFLPAKSALGLKDSDQQVTRIVFIPCFGVPLIVVLLSGSVGWSD